MNKREEEIHLYILLISELVKSAAFWNAETIQFLSTIFDGNVIQELKQQKDMAGLSTSLSIRLSEKPDFYSDLKNIRAVVLFIVKLNGLALKKLPLFQDDDEICLAAVNQNGMALEFVSRNINSYLSIARAAIDNNPFSVEFVPRKFNASGLYEQAVTKNGLTLELLIMSQDDFDICIKAVRQNPFALAYVDEDVEGYEMICEEAISLNPYAARYISNSLPSKIQLWIKAVSKDGMVLETLPRDAQNKPSVCLAAVRENPWAISFVSTSIRENLVKALSKEFIDKHHSILKKFINLPETEHNVRKIFLSTIEHIIVTDDSESDQEVDDACAVYTNSDLRKGKCMVVSASRLSDILEEFSTNNIDGKKLNLTFIGHATTKSEKISGVNLSEIHNLVKKYNNIGRITLLGCSTVQSKMLEEEKLDLIKFHSSNNEDLPHGFVVMAKEPMSKEDYSRVLKQIKLDSTYVIIKADANSEPKLKYIQKLEDGTFKTQIHNLSADDIKLLQDALINGKKFTFPGAKNSSRISPLRDSKKPLSAKEYSKVSSISGEDKKFDKSHPDYKKTKKKHSFLHSYTIQEKEAEEKMTSSLMQKLFLSLKKDPDIKNRELILKGYTTVINIDIPQKGFFISRKPVYKKEYAHKFLKFKPSDDNIDRAKMLEERRMILEKMRKPDKGENSTTAKSIKVNIKK